MKKFASTKIIFIIIISSTMLGFIFNYFSSDGIDFIRKERIIKMIESVNLLEDSSSESIKGIRLEEVIKLFNSNEAIFVDARDQWDFAENHIDGAINIPEFSFQEDNKVLSSYDKSQLFVVYCDGDDCDISIRLVEQFYKLGYINSFVYIGGFNEWLKKGLPISSNENI